MFDESVVPICCQQSTYFASYLKWCPLWKFKLLKTKQNNIICICYAFELDFSQRVDILIVCESDISMRLQFSNTMEFMMRALSFESLFIFFKFCKLCRWFSVDKFLLHEFLQDFFVCATIFQAIEITSKLNSIRSSFGHIVHMYHFSSSKGHTTLYLIFCIGNWIICWLSQRFYHLSRKT